MSSMFPFIFSRVLKEPHRGSKTKVQRKIGAEQTLTSTKIRVGLGAMEELTYMYTRHVYLRHIERCLIWTTLNACVL